MKTSNLIAKIEALSDGRKTYLIAIIAAVLAFLESLDIYTVPVWAWPLLGAAGLGSLRLGVSKMKNSINEITKKGK